MKCELLQFFFSADVAGSATPHLLIDMVEVMEKEHGTEVDHCSPLLQKVYKYCIVTHFNQLQNQYLNTPLGSPAPIIPLKLVSLKRTHMNITCNVSEVE